MRIYDGYVSIALQVHVIFAKAFGLRGCKANMNALTVP